MLNKTMILMALMFSASLSAPAADDKPQPASAPTEGVALTVYNGGYGVVREVRAMEIGQGEVKFTDVAAAIDPTSVHFRSLTDPTAVLLEQNYQYDLVSADKLLGKYIERPITVICADKRYSGTLLSFDAGQIVLKEEGGITMVQRAENVRDIQFKDLPEGLLTRPTLVWQVQTQKPGKQIAEVTYQTNNVNWHAEYVLVVNAADSAADLSGWVSVQNNSGKTYKDAKLKCIAGDVRRVVEEEKVDFARLTDVIPGSQPAMEEKAFFEYHMYTLPRASTIGDNEIKQLEMFEPAHDVKLQKKYVYEPIRVLRSNEDNIERTLTLTSPAKVQVFIEFKNAQENHLGMPLPAGKVRVFKQDPADKALEFIGEEMIDHTPKDEKLSLQIGNAFDIVGEWKQTDFQEDKNRHWMKESIEVKVRNHKKEDINIRIKLLMHPSQNWKITEKSADFVKLDASTIAFDQPVKADGETVVTYTVEYTW